MQDDFGRRLQGNIADGIFFCLCGLVYRCLIAGVLRVKPPQVELIHFAGPGLFAGLTILISGALLLKMCYRSNQPGGEHYQCNGSCILFHVALDSVNQPCCRTIKAHRINGLEIRETGRFLLQIMAPRASIETVEIHLVTSLAKSLAAAPPASPKPAFSPVHNHNAGNGVSLAILPEHGFGSDQSHPD